MGSKIVFYGDLDWLEDFSLCLTIMIGYDHWLIINDYLCIYL